MNKLILAATVYFLWNERNKRIFQDSKRTKDAVISVIKKYMEDILQSLRVKEIKSSFDGGQYVEAKMGK